MILRFAKEQTQALRDEKFREFCDLTSQALNVSIENAKSKEIAGAGDYLLIGTHIDTTLELDLDSEEPIRLDGFECIYVPRAEADVKELRSNDEWNRRFATTSVDRNFAGLKLHEFIMSEVSTGGESADKYQFVIKIIGT